MNKYITSYLAAGALLILLLAFTMTQLARLIPALVEPLATVSGVGGAIAAILLCLHHQGDGAKASFLLMFLIGLGVILGCN